MTTANGSSRRCAKLLVVDCDGRIRHLPRAALACLFSPGDLIIANDAATLPASLRGIHYPSGGSIEVRLAAWESVHDPTQFTAIAFGAGDYRTPTEDRISPPPLSPGDHLALGPLVGVVEGLLDHPRLFRLRFLGDRARVFAGLARHGRPIQYAHEPKPLALWDVWTKIASDPIAFEPPSAGFALDWRTQSVWRQRCVGFATLTHAAGISSTGDRALDLRLPFDEPYCIHRHTASAVNDIKSKGGRIVAVGTSVVRALESAANADGTVRVGNGIARGRIRRNTAIRVVDAILTGVHRPGESHFELLEAFVDDPMLAKISNASIKYGYHPHDFGDSILIERRTRRVCRCSADTYRTESGKERAQSGGRL
jgi:S-adenosylmethionine:tRNA ribosyltransferase-isomerase